MLNTVKAFGRCKVELNHITRVSRGTSSKRARTRRTFRGVAGGNPHARHLKPFRSTSKSRRRPGRRSFPGSHSPPPYASPGTQSIGALRLRRGERQAQRGGPDGAPFATSARTGAEARFQRGPVQLRETSFANTVRARANEADQSRHETGDGLTSRKYIARNDRTAPPSVFALARDITPRAEVGGEPRTIVDLQPGGCASSSERTRTIKVGQCSRQPNKAR